MATDASKAYKEAVEASEKLLNIQEGLVESTKRQKMLWDGISSEIFGISGAAFFKEVDKSTEKIKEQQEELKKAGINLDLITKQFQNNINQNSFIKELQEQISGIEQEKYNKLREEQAQLNIMSQTISKLREESEKDIENKIKLKKLQDQENIFYNRREELEKKQTKYFEEIVNQRQSFLAIENESERVAIARAIQEGRIGEYITDNGDKALANLGIVMDLSNEQIKMYQNVKDSSDAYGQLKKEASNTKEEVFSIRNGMNEFANKILKDALGTLMKYDETIHNIQMNTGANLMGWGQINTQLQQTAVHSNRFGMDMEEVGKSMESMGNELRTTNGTDLLGMVNNFGMFKKATGAAISDIESIAGELGRAGSNADDITGYMQQANIQSKMFGVSTKSVMKGLSENINKMRAFGFDTGEKSLIKMTALSERLRIKVDSIFDMASKARNIEGALEMASELQLAGGSFAQINPMDLLSAARKGPEELGKILTQMGGDIGKFNKETGKFDFDPIDVDRLNIVAKATGVSLGDLQNSIRKTAEDSKKLEGFGADFFNVKDMDTDAVKAQISDALDISKDGTIKVKTDNIFGVKNIEEFKNLTQAEIADKIKLKQQDAADLEKQAQENMALKESFKNFYESFLHSLMIFRPMLDVLGKFFKWLGEGFDTLNQKIGPVFGGLTAALLLAVGTFGAKKATGFVGNMLGSIGKSGGDSSESGGGGFLKKIFSGFSKQTESVGDIGGAKKGKEQGGFFKGLFDSIGSIKISWEGILKFTAALALIGGSIIAFIWGLNKVGGIESLSAFASAAGSLLILGGIVVAFSYLGKGSDTSGILKMAAAMVLIGISLIPFVYAGTMLKDFDWSKMLIAIGILTGVTLALGLLGNLMTSVLPGLLISLAAFSLVSVGMMIFAKGMTDLSLAASSIASVDWSGFGKMGSAFLSIIPGFTAFMLLANPISLLGIGLLILAIGGLAAVMSPLSESLTTGASGLINFSDGLNKLQTTVNALDLDKLEKLKDVTSSMSENSVGSVLSNIANKLVGVSTPSGAQGNGKVDVTIHLKQNGRDLQTIILKDTEILK